jgi:hypothetical protein
MLLESDLSVSDEVIADLFKEALQLEGFRGHPTYHSVPLSPYSEGSSLMPELVVIDLTLSTEDSAKTVIASSRVRRVVSGSEAWEGEVGGLG